MIIVKNIGGSEHYQEDIVTERVHRRTPFCRLVVILL